MITLFSSCPKCGYSVSGAFPNKCPNCTFDISALIGLGTSSFQKRNWNKHTDLLQGRDIQLQPGGTYNASFDYNGHANLADIVRFTITYGDRTTLQSPRGSHSNPLIIAYIPERIGAGTAIHFPGTVACSGICLMSPQSEKYGHPFPIIDEWVQNTFAGSSSFCRICKTPTSFAQPICADCYAKNGSDWKNFM
jgi:hypothetical protein